MNLNIAQRAQGMALKATMRLTLRFLREAQGLVSAFRKELIS
jgi:hypothetical protein